MRVYCIPTGTEIADAGRTVFVFKRAFRNKQFEKKNIQIGPETAKLQAFFCRSLEGHNVVVCLTTPAAAAAEVSPTAPRGATLAPAAASWLPARARLVFYILVVYNIFRQLFDKVQE